MPLHSLCSRTCLSFLEDPQSSLSLAPPPTLAWSFPGMLAFWPWAHESLSPWPACQPQPTCQPQLSSRKEQSLSEVFPEPEGLSGGREGEDSYQVSDNGLSRTPWNVEEGEIDQLGFILLFPGNLPSSNPENFLSSERLPLGENTWDSPSSSWGHPTIPASSVATPNPPAAMLGVRTGAQAA